MRIIKILILSVFVMIPLALIAQEIQTDYDHTTDFSKYKTFTWIKQPKTENPLMQQRIIDAINTQLEAKGLQLVSTGAELGISANTATKEQQTLNSFYDGFYGWGWHRYWGPVTVETYTVGTLVVDLFDIKTKQVKWWGTASDTISDKPEKNAKKLNEAVEKMFKHFPPKGTPKTD